MSSPRSPGLSTFLLALALLLGGCQVSGPELGSPSSVHNQDLAGRQPLSDVASYSAARSWLWTEEGLPNSGPDT